MLMMRKTYLVEIKAELPPDNDDIEIRAANNEILTKLAREQMIKEGFSEEEAEEYKLGNYARYLS